MTEWRETTLGDFSPLRYGANLPSASRKNGDVPVVSSAGFIDKHDEALVNCAGLVIGRKGTVGSVTLVEQPFWPIDTTFYVADDPTERDLRFAYYLLSSLGLNQMNSDSAVPGLNRENAHAVRFKCPPLPEQRAIAGVLGVLDDKIAANRAMNDTLEKMARAIFTDWFVDFGPTRAKMAGDAPYLAPEIWDLFPDTIDPTTTLPTGWEMKPLDEIATFLNGLALQKYPAKQGEEYLPVIKIAELRNGVTPKTDRASTDIPEAYAVTDRDFLFSWSGSLLAKFWYGGKGALNQHLFKVTSKGCPSWYSASWVQHHIEEFRTIAASKAVTMGHIKREHLHEAKVCVPKSQLMRQMNQIMLPLLERQHDLEIESQTLAKMRDLLLSPLMSGKLRVATADDHPAPKPTQKLDDPPKSDDPPTPTQQPEDRDGEATKKFS